MLRIINSMNQINFSELMNVYYEGNMENGAVLYSHLSKESQIREAEIDFYRYLRETFFSTKNAFYAIWDEDHHYCSALRMEPYHDGWLLCALETAPNERNKGYASALIQAVKGRLTDSGNFKIYSHVSKRNISSIRTHQKCGFHKLLDYAVYLDGSVFHNSYTYIYENKTSET